MCERELAFRDGSVCVSFNSLRMGRVHIDRKIFNPWLSGCGRKVVMEERRGAKVRKMVLEKGTTVWVRDCLVAAARLDRPKGFWRRRRLDAAIIFFQVLENASGRFSLLSLEPVKGRRSTLYIPKGFNGKGWSLVAGDMASLLFPLEVSKGNKEITILKRDEQ